MRKETFKRVRFIACGEGGDASLLVGREGVLIHGGDRRYTQAGFDCMVMLDEQADDESAREYFDTFAGCWFPNIERWSKEKWGARLVVEADSAEHLEIIGSQEIEFSEEAAKPSSRLICESSIELREGIEGPKDDPYSYDEWTLTRGADTWVIHVGLGEWIKRNGAIVAEPEGGETEAALKAAGCPLSLRHIKRYYRRIKALPFKLHKAHGGVREAGGMPGETLYICKCGAILDCDFNIGAII